MVYVFVMVEGALTKRDSEAGKQSLFGCTGSEWPAFLYWGVYAVSFRAFAVLAFADILALWAGLFCCWFLLVAAVSYAMAAR